MNKTKILDGAMGTELIQRGEILPPHIWSAKINLTNPKLIYQIHKEYIDAGANYITTNTFRSTTRAFKKTGLNDLDAKLSAEQSFLAAIQMAQKASKKNTRILGSIAPLEDCYLPNLFPGQEQAKKEFTEIAQQFKFSGVHILILETMTNIDETKICLDAIKSLSLPIWVSYNLINAKQIRSGESLNDAINLLKNYPVDCLLLNCNSIKRTNDALNVVFQNWNHKWGIYPNIGLGEPASDGIIKHYSTNEKFVNVINKAKSLGAYIVGACCGSNPKHIQLIS